VNPSTSKLFPGSTFLLLTKNDEYKEKCSIYIPHFLPTFQEPIRLFHIVDVNVALTLNHPPSIPFFANMFKQMLRVFLVDTQHTHKKNIFSLSESFLWKDNGQLKFFKV